MAFQQIPVTSLPVAVFLCEKGGMHDDDHTDFSFIEILRQMLSINGESQPPPGRGRSCPTRPGSLGRPR